MSDDSVCLTVNMALNILRRMKMDGHGDEEIYFNDNVVRIASYLVEDDGVYFNGEK